MIIIFKSQGWVSQRAWATLGVLAVLLFLLMNDVTRSAVVLSISSAYITVTSFVAATLAVFYFFEHRLNFDAGAFLERYKRFQVLISAVAGATPGCGGAIIIVTQYTSGRLSFGSLVAALTATMGDAAFLLIARSPIVALLVISLQFVAALFAGYLADLAVDRGWLKIDLPKKPLLVDQASLDVRPASDRGALGRVWLWLVVPALVLGIASAFQVDMDAALRPLFQPLLGLDAPATAFGFVGGLLCIFMWLSAPSLGISHNLDSDGQLAGTLKSRLIGDTNFVTFWVVVAFMAYEVPVVLFDIDLESLFSAALVWLPLIAIVIGFIPGCGPQIALTTLYLAGLVPLSAQIGNAISNDGDALFPALALAPRAAAVATVVSAIPALIFAYGFMLLFE